MTNERTHLIPALTDGVSDANQMMTKERFLLGKCLSMNIYFASVFFLSTVAFLLVYIFGESWIKAAFAQTESWDRSNWAKAVYIVSCFGLLFATVRAALRFSRARQEERDHPTPEPGEEIPTSMHAAWLKIALQPGGSGYADWVIAKSNPDDSYDRILANANRLRENDDRDADHRDPDVARHEAGHAVVAHALGFTVISATVKPGETFVGSVTHAKPFPRIKDIEAAWAHLIIALAGHVVDLGKSVHDMGSTRDLGNAFTDARKIISIGLQPDGYTGPLNVQALLDGARAVAQQIVANNRTQIEDLGARLFDKQILGNHAMRDILERVKPHLPGEVPEPKTLQGANP